MARSILEVLYQPLHRYWPRFRVRFQAAMYRLVELDAVEAVVAKLTRRFGISLTPAEVELAADFPGGFREARALNRQLYAPRTRTAKAVYDRFGREVCTYRGTRNSAQSQCVYVHTEDDFQVARCEWRLRRGALRRKRANAVTDLRTFPWGSSRPFQFVEVDLDPDRYDMEKGFFADIVHLFNPTGALKHCGSRRRPRLRAMFRPATAQRELEKALRRFEAKVRKPR